MNRKIYALPLAAVLLLTACARGDQAQPAATEAAHIHSYENKVVGPTCTEEGYTLRTCSCGDSYKADVLSALGHNYETAVVDETYTERGYTQYTCLVCDHTYQGDFVEPMPAKVSSLAENDFLLPIRRYSRESPYAMERVVLHFVSGVVLSREDPYNKDLVRGIFTDYQVSVHYIIDREGGIRCYVPENRVAYHAGYGSWGGIEKYTDWLNDYSIGIEIMAIGSQQDMAQYLDESAYNSLDPSLIGYTDAQYDALIALLKDICARHKIPMDREHIIGHEEYSPDKTDPGELFDWDRLFS